MEWLGMGARETAARWIKEAAEALAPNRRKCPTCGRHTVHRAVGIAHVLQTGFFAGRVKQEVVCEDCGTRDDVI
jgi:hypothetical protein